MPDEFDCSLPAYFLTHPDEMYTDVYDDYVIQWGVWRDHHDEGGEG